jgi:hypothetical protein
LLFHPGALAAITSFNTRKILLKSSVNGEAKKNNSLQIQHDKWRREDATMYNIN